MPAKQKRKTQQWERSDKKESFWRRQLTEWKSSGLSVRAFCRESDLSENSFYAWRRELAIRDREKAASRVGGVVEPSPAQVLDSRGRSIPFRHRNVGPVSESSEPESNPFVPLKLASNKLEATVDPSMASATSSCTGGINVTTPNGFSISITSSDDVGLLAEVVKALEAETC